MLNISTTHAVSWPPPVSAQVAAVSAVDPVRPVQDGRRSGQSGHDAQTPDAARRQKKDVGSPEPDRVPLLPRQGRSEGDRAAPGAAQGRGVADDAALREAGAVAKELAAEKAEAQTRRQQLQAVLSDVWKASAAVVERVLGLDDAPRHGLAAGGVDGVEPASTTGPVALKRPTLEPLPWPVMPEDPALAIAGKAAQAELAPVQEVVAYDERGNSSLAPLETGVLIDQRV
jgi:hypothetical protein